MSASRTIKDLGIIFEDNCKFVEHISKIIDNANSKLGSIKNTFHELTKGNFIILYIKHSFGPSLNIVVQLGPLIVSSTIKKLWESRKGQPN